MHIDAREIENNSIIEGDICIVGAGASGISIALEFINTPYKVILLEGGGFEYDDKVQNLYKGKTTGQKYYPMRSSRLHYFGGASQHWGGMCSTLDKIDFEKRDWVPYSGWPITKKDLDAFYEKAQKNLDLGPFEYDLEFWQKKYPNFNPFQLDDAIVWNKMWQFSPPTQFGSKYKDTIVSAKNIYLYTYANATNIKTNDEVDNVSEITVKNYADKSHTVKAKHYILACGAIQNSRLLLASNSQAKKGLGNDNDLVGRFFMEHPEINSAELWLSKDHIMDLYLLSSTNGKTDPRAELAITEEAQKELKILNGTVSFFPLTQARHLKPNMQVWQNENPMINREISKHGETKSFWERVGNKIDRIKEAQEKNIDRAFQLYIRLEQSPNPNSRITLDAKKDSLGVPRANLHWQVTDLEKESIRKIFTLLGQQFGLSDVGRVRLLEFLQDKDNSNHPEYNGGWHHIGTTRMSDDVKNGVVDKNCKVHGLDNLFVAGSGCFPTSGAANPTLTVVAISIRLANYIKEIA